MEERKDFRKPGRGGYTQRRGFYGATRGYNSRNFGGHTWTFYETDQWEKFQSWMKDEKTKKKQEETKFLIEGIADLMDNKLRKRKGRQKGKRKENSSEEDSSDSSSSSDDRDEKKDLGSKVKSPQKKTGKSKQEWREKRKENDRKEIIPIKMVMDSLGRIEERIKGVEIKNKDMESEIRSLRDRNSMLEERNRILVEERERESEPEDMSRFFQRVDEEKGRDDKWREVQSRFKGKEGTAELKKWCQENEVPYKNKDNAMMAVIASEDQED